MDQFKLELATSNEDLVKILRAFIKVEDKIDIFSDWSEGLDRLELSPVEETEENVDIFSILSIVLVAVILPPLFVSSYVLLKKSLIWLIKKAGKRMKREEKENKDYAKLEENKSDAVELEEPQRKSRTSRLARSVASCVGHDLCLVLGLLFVLCSSGKYLERWGCNTGSVQIFIGDGDMNLYQLGEYTEQALEEINQDMFLARTGLSNSVEVLEKYDPDIQDIILSRIDRVTEKGDIITERASNLAEYLKDCERKKIVIGLSSLYFLSYVVSAYIGVRFSVSGLGDSLVSSLAYGSLGLVSHGVLFLASSFVWIVIYVPLLTMFVYSQSHVILQFNLADYM